MAKRKRRRLRRVRLMGMSTPAPGKGKLLAFPKRKPAKKTYGRKLEKYMYKKISRVRLPKIRFPKRKKKHYKMTMYRGG